MDNVELIPLIASYLIKVGTGQFQVLLVQYLGQ